MTINSDMPAGNADGYALEELRRESTIGGIGQTVERQIPRIDLADFDRRRAEITQALWEAATRIVFFQVYNHGIPETLIDETFDQAWKFFELPTEQKSLYPLRPGTNAGWEFRAQVRPSTGTPDHKESYQVTRPNMSGLWPSEETLPGFQATMAEFERHNWTLGMRVLSCFATELGFEEDFFTKRHDPDASDYQSTVRLIHYLGMEDAKPEDFNSWRAGAHTDFDCLTLLHQRPGQGGLQLCPGKELDSGNWTDVPPEKGYVTCNIGDMLMRWSDDRLLSTLHRVRMPRPGEYMGKRLSVPFFCQANKSAIIAGPEGKYPPISAADYLRERQNANFRG